MSTTGARAEMRVNIATCEQREIYQAVPGEQCDQPTLGPPVFCEDDPECNHEYRYVRFSLG